MQMLANVIVIIILQYVNVYNQHVIHLKFTQCLTSTSVKLERFFLKEKNEESQEMRKARYEGQKED